MMRPCDFHHNRGKFYLVLYPSTMSPSDITGMQLAVMECVNRDLRDDIKTVRASEADVILSRVDELLRLICNFQQRMAGISEHLRVNKWILIPTDGVPDDLSTAMSSADGTFIWDSVSKTLSPVTQ